VTLFTYIGSFKFEWDLAFERRVDSEENFYNAVPVTKLPLRLGPTKMTISKWQIL